MSFSDEVRKWMVVRGLEDHDWQGLCYLCRVPKDTLKKMLEENRDPRLSNAVLIADGLKVPLDKLVHPERDCTHYQDFYDSIQQVVTTPEYNDNKKRPKRG